MNRRQTSSMLVKLHGGPLDGLEELTRHTVWRDVHFLRLNGEVYRCISESEKIIEFGHCANAHGVLPLGKIYKIIV